MGKAGSEAMPTPRWQRHPVTPGHATAQGARPHPGHPAGTTDPTPLEGGRGGPGAPHSPPARCRRQRGASSHHGQGWAGSGSAGSGSPRRDQRTHTHTHVSYTLVPQPEVTPTVTAVPPLIRSRSHICSQDRGDGERTASLGIFPLAPPPQTPSAQFPGKTAAGPGWRSSGCAHGAGMTCPRSPGLCPGTGKG